MNMLIQMPKRTEARQRILKQVMDKYDVTPEEFFGKRRNADVVDARKEAARRLLDAGFDKASISRILRRDHTTIEYYFSGDRNGTKLKRVRLYRLLLALPDEVRIGIERLADARGIAAYALAHQWLVERAAIELGAKVAA